MTSIETTFVIIKGDAVRRGLVGRIISRFEEKGLAIVGMRMLNMTKEQAESLYAEHKGKAFFDGLVSFSTGTPVIAMLLRGNLAVSVARKLMGATSCPQAEPGTIRGDFGISCSNRTLVHGSRTTEDANREMAIFFADAWVVGYYERCDCKWLVNPETEL